MREIEHLAAAANAEARFADEWRDRALKAEAALATAESQIDFAQGVIYACARLIENHDQPSMAEEILDQSGVDVSLGLEHDLAFIRRISKFKKLPRGSE